MDKIKNFFAKKKTDRKFKTAGQGHSLQGPSAPSARPQPARPAPPPVTQNRIESAEERAAAATRRLQAQQGVKQLTRSQQAVRAEARKELEREREKQAAAEIPKGPEEKDFVHAPVVEGVYFTCDLLADDIVLRKDDMNVAVRQFLEEQMSDEPVVASVLMLHSLNRREKRTTAIDVIGKFLNNIIAHPEDEKYRKIRIGNPAVQDRVLSAKGGKEFLLAVGFEETELTNQEGVMEGFLLISQERANQTEALIQAKQVLDEGVPVPLKLHRNPEVKLVTAQSSQSNDRVPEEFYDLTAEDVKREQQAKTELSDQMLSLRTREMRARDETLRVFKYKYCLIKIKFPNSYILQGTFGTKEKFSMVRQFVQSNLKVEGPPFVLKTATGDVVSHDSDEKLLGDLGLAPAALLRFEWDADVLLEWSTNNMEIPFLKDELY